MRFVDIIEKKRNGLELTPEEIHFFVEGYTNDSLPDYQVSALLMAIYFQGMTTEEISNLTMEMVRSGDQIDLSAIAGKKADKHSTGGVGDTTTLVLAPLVAATGAKVAKMSGRGLGHTGGTLDKLEAIKDFDIELTQEEFIKQVNDIDIAVIGQSGNITPADKKIYALRDVTGTVKSIPLIASSIMSKKIAAGSDVVCLDVKVGDGAFMKNVEEATELAETMVNIGKQLGRKTMAFLTNMDEPLGYKIGNALEIEEVIDTLEGHGPEDLTELCLQIGSYMLYNSDEADSLEDARTKLEEVLYNGKALAKFKEFITAQGGDVNAPLPTAEKKIPVYPTENGYVAQIKTEEIGTAAMHLGAGRATKEDVIDYAVGIETCAKVGDAVTTDKPIAYIYSNGKNEDLAEKFILDSFVISQEPQPKPELIYKIVE